MNKFDLSIIVPVYNCEKYIRKCLDSVCTQKVARLQVICINDSSQDDSLHILKEYAEKYKFVEIYSNEYNVGLAATRNRGIKLAQGKYIMFLDADDYIREDTLNRVLENTYQNEVDILLYDMLMIWDNSEKKNLEQQWRIRKNAYKQEKGIDMLCALIKNKEMSGTACGGIYKKHFLVDNNIFFIDNILHEDIPFSFHAMLYAKKVFYLHEIVYCYRQQNDSILHSPNYKKLLEGIAVGYKYIQNLWNQYMKAEAWNRQQERFIKQYLDDLHELMEQRYIGLLESSEYVIDESLRRIVINNNLLAPSEIKKYIDNKTVDMLKGEKRIVIYGAGYYAKKIYLLLKQNGINIEKFYVTKVRNNPSILLGLPVKRYINNDNQECIIVAVSRNQQNQIVNYISKENSKIICIK